MAELTDTEKAIEIYERAISLAKFELDAILPEYNKLKDRVTILRRFVTAGMKVLEQDIDNVDEKYINVWETQTYQTMKYNSDNRKRKR